ncbi:MAG: tRNA (adenosine(37)-N6)-dimethylallyltransferase MiaA [SAR202 cluster bacterium Io17-Chloro-G7]|nr:MAG: tRNA (adenosine(37)-N6)-dimethylallyltransferase MiaA [SAR202 cluster bacterium Io17-Chloro-G7]
MGKTNLAITLARQFNGEIVNADSRQVYRHMDIGTAKPSAQQQQQAPHHLLDILDPDQNFDLATFLSLARDAISEIQGRGRLPIVVGGTGQYIWALVEGWNVPEVPPDAEYRAAKQAEAEQHGPEFIYQQLQAVDPVRATQLDFRNLRRVIRALEVHHAQASQPRTADQAAEGLAHALIIGLTMDRTQLYRRIDDRIDWMMAEGLEEEVRSLAALGYVPGKGPLAGPGYRELGEYLSGSMSLEEAVQRTKFQTHRLVRRQYNWFKLGDPRIKWLAGPASPGVSDLQIEAGQTVGNFLSGRACYGTITADSYQISDDMGTTI